MATQIDIGINVDGDMDGYVIGGRCNRRNGKIDYCDINGDAIGSYYVNGDDIDIQND
jgi:hypothetical protein